jgi:hypothetical protein
MALWSIKIVAGESAGDPPQFVPQLQPGGAEGLLAETGDSVSWNNTTTESQQPWPLGADSQPLPRDQVAPTRGKSNSIYLSDEIPPGHSSRPSWIVNTKLGPVINYCSLSNQQAQGVITITNFPAV